MINCQPVQNTYAAPVRQSLPSLGWPVARGLPVSGNMWVGEHLHTYGHLSKVVRNEQSPAQIPAEFKDPA